MPAYDTVRPALEGFTRESLELTQRIADELARSESSSDVLEAIRWRDLAVRIESAVLGYFAPFSRDDVKLCAAFHNALLRAPLAEGVKEQSGQLSRLGVTLLLASRGKLSPARA